MLGQWLDLQKEHLKIKNTNEYLTLFLEKSYTSYITNEETIKIERLFIELLKIKAKKMNAILVLSCNYNEAAKEQFISTRYNIYISKSKSSSQYLDSLSGENSITDEGQYRSNTFMIWQNTKNI